MDRAIVRQESIVRERPCDSCEVLVKASPGETLVLIDRTPEGDWYNVIHVASGLEGWVSSSGVKIEYSKQTGSSPIFQAEKTGTYENPEIEITNASHIELRLKVGLTVHVISPNTNETIRNIAPGNHKYYASAAGVIPKLGEKNFESGQPVYLAVLDCDFAPSWLLTLRIW